MIANLKPGAHIHMMGICGTAMASLAGLLKDRGFHVTGSDQNVYPPMSVQIANMGIEIMQGYKRENLKNRPDLIIVGNVISKHFEEAQEMLEKNIPYTSLPQAMGELVIADRHSIVVSGTHGKTTTTSLMAWIATCCGKSPGFMIGGIPKNFSKSYELPKGHFFVIEGDEYDTAFFDKVPKFVHYRPRSVILTSVEFDHADIYKDLDAVKAAFIRLLKLIPQDGCLVTNAEDPNIQSILGNCATPRIKTFGLHHGDYQARQIQDLAQGEGMSFEIVRPVKQGKPENSAKNVTPTNSPDAGGDVQVVATIKTGLMGEYNVKNILAAYALSEELGWNHDQVVSAIARFEGVKRRQDIIGRPNNITVIEDFAHHPTAVRTTIETVQKKFKRVFSVLELRSATSRRNVFQNDYAEALSVAQDLFLPPAFNQANIPEDQRFDTEKLISDLKAKNVRAHLCGSTDEIVSHIRSEARPGDAVLIMSNGGFDGIYEKLLTNLAEAKL